ncbi:MAG: hypothetical protein ACQ9ET_02815 [Nitrosomonadaceae bacterium]
MYKLPHNVIADLIEFRTAQNELLADYESEKNNEMAFLVRWSILEYFVKAIAAERRRIQLRNSLLAWLSYVDGDAEKPSKNPQTSIEARTLPNKSEFIVSLNDFGFKGNEVWELMDSRGKYRRHRNELAHTGKKFINALNFYFMCVQMDKLINKVFRKIESNK